MKYKLYSSIMVLIIVMVLVCTINQFHIEHFDWSWSWHSHYSPPPFIAAVVQTVAPVVAVVKKTVATVAPVVAVVQKTVATVVKDVVAVVEVLLPPASEITNIMDRLTELTKRVTDLPATLETSAKNTVDDTVASLLIPPKALAAVLKGSIKQLEKDFKELFNIFPKLFDKLKYFTELLMISVNRAKVCAEGAERIVKNYTLKTTDIITELGIIHKKIKICPTNPLKNPTTYYNECVSQIIPLIKACYTYTNLLMDLYQDLLTYEELFPQNIYQQSYCRSQYAKVRTKKEAVEYANKCNYCLHLQSVLKLGLGELKDFAKLIKEVSSGGAKLERAFGNLTINI